MRALTTTILVAVLMVAAGPARAQDPAPAPAPVADPAPAPAPAAEPVPLAALADSAPGPATEDPLFLRGGVYGWGLVLAPKIGGGFSQPFGDLGSSVVAELEVGWLLPLPAPVNRRFELFFSGQYAGPKTTGSTIQDPRLPGDGTAKYSVTERMAVLTLGLLYRQPLPDPVKWLAPYVALGARAYLLRTEASGSANEQPFGENRETSTSWGVYSALGADFFVGPGSILIEFQVGWAPTDRYIFRNTNVGSLNLVAGYRFML